MMASRVTPQYRARHRMGRCAWLALLPASLLLAAWCTAGTFTYPPGPALVVDVTLPPWNIDNTGTSDVSDALQNVIDTFKADNTGAHVHIIYLPSGTYRVSKRLRGGEETAGGGWVVIQGQSRTGTVIRLQDNCNGSGGTEDFTNPAQPRAVLDYFTSDWSNNAFINVLENLTVDVGSGNAGAIGVHFFDNNCGCVRGVTLRASGADPVGAVGLSTALRGPNGVGLIKDIYVEGFAIGISFDNEERSVMPWSLEDITVVNQTAYGIAVARKPLALRRLTSTNSVPAVRVRHDAALVTLLDSVCVGGAATSAAVHVESGSVFVRNVAMQGYTATVYDTKNGGWIAGDFSTGEYRSAAGARLWDDTPLQSLNLPVAATPEAPWDAHGEWALVDVNAQDDDTEAVRAAMESGKTTVAFTPGVCTLSDTIVIGRQVRRILGQWVRLHATSGLRLNQPPRPMFRLEDSAHAAVVFEKFDSAWSGTNLNVYLMHQTSAADLALRDIFWVQGAAYRNDPVAGGRLFVENVHSLRGMQRPFTNDPAWVIVNQDMYARQLNPEMLMPHVVNAGGRVWVFGAKFGEAIGPVVQTTHHGETEIYGALHNTTYDFYIMPQEDFSLIENDNGRVSAVMLERTTWGDGGNGWGFHSNVVRETRGTEQRRILHTASGTGPWSNHWFSNAGVTNRAAEHGAFIPFYAGYPAPNPTNTPPALPAISGSSVVTFPAPALLSAASSDSDGPLAPAVRWAKQTGPGAASFSAPTASATSVTFSRPGAYVLGAMASDGLAATTSYVSVHSVFESEWRAPLRAEGRMDDTTGDGQGNAVYAGPLRVGEPAEGQEYRVQFDFDLRAMAAMTDGIGRVTLRLTPSALNAPPDVDLLLVASYGAVTTGDFGSAGVLAASTNAAAFAAHQPILLDVTEAVRGALADGRVSLGLRLQRHANQAGAPHYVEYYPASDATRGARLLLAPAAPRTPLNLHTTLVTQTNIMLAWNDGGGSARAFVLQRRNDDTGTWHTLATLAPSVTVYDDEPPANPAITFYYRVAATNLAGASPFSNIAEAQLVPEPAWLPLAAVMLAGVRRLQRHCVSASHSSINHYQ